MEIPAGQTLLHGNLPLRYDCVSSDKQKRLVEENLRLSFSVFEARSEVAKELFHEERRVGEAFVRDSSGGG